MSAARRPPSRMRGFLNLVIFVAVVGVGGLALVPLWHALHPAGGGEKTAASPASSGPSSGASAGASGGAGGGRAGKDGATPGGTGPARSAPPEVVFDDFHYTGRDDPALKAHGWQARTEGGGPGIHDTWSPSGISFPSVSSAKGGHALQLQLHTDGTKKGTRQTELLSSLPDFSTGTYAARVYITDAPATGSNGDHVNESFYTISPPEAPAYSELDYEYMPNGGWGSKRPELDTTSWHSARDGDRVYHPAYQRVHGWHTFMITTMHGVTTYSLDGRKLFGNGAAYSPHGPMHVKFSLWLIDLPFTGARTWNMQVNWFYYRAGKAQSLSQVQRAVDGYYAKGTHYVRTPAAG